MENNLSKNLDYINTEEGGELKAENWKERGFNFDEHIKKTKGQFIEVAGPTDEGYRLVDIEKLPRKIYITNLFPGRPHYKMNEKDEIIFDSFRDKVDFQADATTMPLKDQSIGGVFCSCLSIVLSPDSSNVTERESSAERKRLTKLLKEDAMLEAWRILEPNGVLVWQSGVEGDFAVARRIGFKMVQYQRESEKDQNLYDFIFIKENSSN